MKVLPEPQKMNLTNLSFGESVGVLRRLGIINVLVARIAPMGRIDVSSSTNRYAVVLHLLTCQKTNATYANRASNIDVKCVGHFIPGKTVGEVRYSQ